MRKTYLPIALLMVGGYGMSAWAQRPNIILSMTDQQRFDCHGCMGNSTIITPNLDRLAAEGMLLSSAYTSCPSSRPARGTPYRS